MSRASDRLREFWTKVDQRGPMASPYLGPCWLWTAAKNDKGYGVVSIAGRLHRAHRVVYELVKGAIPEGLEPDHLCRRRACVNPAHLEPVTRSENLRRGVGGAIAARRERGKTHCPHGHPYDAANTYRAPDGKRRCRTCRREEARRR